jgi:hypothetical protein
MTRSKNQIDSDPDSAHSVAPGEMSWFERPQNIRKMVIGLVIACVGVSMADFFYTNPHPHFGIESSFAFQAWFGFVTFVVIVFLGRALRWFVSRPEDYYDGDR